MQYMPTNDVFHHLTLLLGLHRDKDLMIEIFESQGAFDITRSKIKAWRTKSGQPSPGFREMPREMLDAFIAGLYEAKLVDFNDNE